MGQDHARLLVVDDDSDLRGLMADFLSDHGFDVATACDAAEMDHRLQEGQADLLILDVMMPIEDGYSVLERLQARDRPAVIMLSAVGGDLDRIKGLELGADDYLAKPCNPRELLARVRAVLRRRNERRTTEAVRRRRFGDCTLDLITRRLDREGRSTVQLTDAEFRVLTVLLDMPQQVLSRDQLLDAARGESAEIFDRAIDVTISRLRRKLGSGDPIRTVRNSGYMLALVPEDA